VPFRKGLDDEADRTMLVELLLGRNTFIVRAGVGLEYDDADLVSEGPAEDVDRHEAPHTPELGLEVEVVAEYSLPVPDLESVKGTSVLVLGVASVASLTLLSICSGAVPVVDERDRGDSEAEKVSTRAG
jgi:hypothetical protein